MRLMLQWMTIIMYKMRGIVALTVDEVWHESP
jgi:hypothetical protein